MQYINSKYGFINIDPSKIITKRKYIFWGEKYEVVECGYFEKKKRQPYVLKTNVWKIDDKRFNEE